MFNWKWPDVSIRFTAKHKRIPIRGYGKTSKFHRTYFPRIVHIKQDLFLHACQIALYPFPHLLSVRKTLREFFCPCSGHVFHGWLFQRSCQVVRAQHGKYTNLESNKNDLPSRASGKCFPTHVLIVSRPMVRFCDLDGLVPLLSRRFDWPCFL